MGENQIGIIGLAVMGANLARNFASKNIRTAVYNRTFQKTEELINNHGNEFLNGFEKLEVFINSLAKPRKIILMIKAGEAIDQMIEELKPFLSEGDYIIDGGNSFYQDTENRVKKCQEYGLNFIGMGISGGEEGALKGPSLMPGITKEDWPKFENILSKIAAKDFQGKACVTPLGYGGVGHYVKMVHNGIEYAIMQMIAEIYDYNRKVKKLNAEQIADIFEKINQSENQSFLSEITVQVLKRKDIESGKFLVDLILDKASQKGTGGWTSIEAIKKGIPTTTIMEATMSRSLSFLKDDRNEFSKMIGRTFKDDGVSIDWNKVYRFGSLIAFIQGFELLNEATKENNWNIDLVEVCRIWQGGCIIRSKMLIELQAMFESGKKWVDLVRNDIQESKKFIISGLNKEIALPAFSSAYNYYLAMTDESHPANLIQGLRDYFGAHTFERVDKEGIFHENWLNE